MKATIFIILSCLYKVTFGQTISLQEYFPLKKGTVREFYVHHLTGTDTLTDKNDSSICKSLVIKGREIFYFDDELNSGDVAVIGSQSFCYGAF